MGGGIGLITVTRNEVTYFVTFDGLRSQGALFCCSGQCTEPSYMHALKLLSPAILSV